MRFAVTVVLALLLLTFQSVLVHRLGLAVTRIDVTVALIAFLALRAGRLEGAFGAFTIGYLLDLLSGRPTGLYVFLAVLILLVGRVGKSVVDVRSGPSFAVFAAALDAVHVLLAVFFTWMTSRGEGGAGFSFGAFVVQVLLTGLCALLLWPLLRRVDPGNERPDSGLGMLR
jgi:rod shape-determining protein MreD